MVTPKYLHVLGGTYKHGIKHAS